jgi:succinate dehydrogenase / fumarate reductase, membrane anchor subunit
MSTLRQAQGGPTTSGGIADPRSPISTPRRRGPNLEKWGWIYMRASGVLLVVLIFGHLFVNLMLGEGIHGLDWGFVAGKLANPFWQWWDILMLWLALIHGANGMRTIVNDYVTHPKTRTVLVWALWLAAGFLILLGTLVVFAFDPCNGVTPDSSFFETCKEIGLS